MHMIIVGKQTKHHIFHVLVTDSACLMRGLKRTSVRPSIVCKHRSFSCCWGGSLDAMIANR